jgi:RNA polymerase sigma factor (sigma-70 family)
MHKTLRLGNCSDDELVRLARLDPAAAGSRQAAGELLGRHRGRVYSWCFRQVGEHELALDLAQDVLFGAYRNLDKFGGRCPFVCWLWMVARNRCLSELRRPSLWCDDEFDLEAVAASQAGPDREFEERLDEERLLQLMQAALDPVERQAIWLRCIEKMPVEAVTIALDLTAASGARAVLQRARRKLRSALDRQADAEFDAPKTGNESP